MVSAANEATRIDYVTGANEVFGQDQEWFRLAPFGDFPVVVTDPKTGRKRRVIQRIDQEAAREIIASFNSVIERIARGFRGLPIFEGHADSPEWRKEHPGARAIAVGRIKRVEARSDGIYAQHALNEEGKRLITGEAAPYDAHSPLWGMVQITKDLFRPVELYSTALTNSPNIPGNVIGINEDIDPATPPMIKELLIKFLAAHGKTPAADATDEQLTTAANEVLATVPALVTAANELPTVKAALTTAQTATTTAANEATALKEKLTSERNARAELILVTAMNEGRITAAQKPEWLGKLIANEADIPAVTAELGKLKAINTSSQLGDIGRRKTESGVSQEKIAAINTAVEAKLTANKNLERVDAYNEVRREKPELFTTAS